MSGCFFWGFFDWFFRHGLRGPVRVVDAKFVAAERVASLEWISANAFFFALNAVLRVKAGEALVRNYREACVKE